MYQIEGKRLDNGTYIIYLKYQECKFVQKRQTNLLFLKFLKVDLSLNVCENYIFYYNEINIKWKRKKSTEIFNKCALNNNKMMKK